MKMIALVSHGCAKNLVDSELILGLLAQNGYEITLNEEDTDTVIVNTCSFICDAERESIRTILELIDAGKKVIAVTRLAKYGEHINDHQIQNNEAFNLNRYVLMADLELENLGECFQKIYDGTDELVPWVNKDPMAIVNMIDKFIQENW